MRTGIARYPGRYRPRRPWIQAGPPSPRPGLTPADVDLVELYDAFTINPILFLEDLGFCAKGEGGAFIGGGRIEPGGGLPVNTNGGGLSFTIPACTAFSW